MTKIMMTGASGRVGKELALYGITPLVGNITKPKELDNTVSREKPDIIVHLAALSDVDYCEDTKNQENVIAVNLEGTYNLLSVAEQYETQVVMLSTDHVFDGGKGFLHKKGPYNETDKPNPLNFYGKSKLAAEALLSAFDNFRVVRTSYLFDWERLKKLSVYDRYPDFIYRSFMYVPTFVSVLYTYLYNLEQMPKLLHISGSQTVSWCGFMKALYPELNIQSRKTDLENDHAPRPLCGGLRTNYKYFLQYSFQDGIDTMKRDIK